jgi:Cu+-exporting ATPase
LEPRDVTAADEVNPSLRDLTRRFWFSVALAVPLLALMIFAAFPSRPLQHLFSANIWAWLEYTLATPVVLWSGWPFLVRGWQSVINRHLNLFTLIALGTGAS